MEPQTNWWRIFGGILLLAIIYLIRRALNVGKDTEYGTVVSNSNIMRPDAYNKNNAIADTGASETWAIVPTWTVAEDELLGQ